MTREDIEKFSDEEPYCFGYCGEAQKRREERWYEIGCIDGLRVADAEPNLESLWHDASEEPKGTYTVLCDGLDNRQWVVDWIYIDMVKEVNWKDYAETISVSRWVYLPDLLPKTK